MALRMRLIPISSLRPLPLAQPGGSGVASLPLLVYIRRCFPSWLVRPEAGKSYSWQGRRLPSPQKRSSRGLSKAGCVEVKSHFL